MATQIRAASKYIGIKGSIHERWVRCGKATCRCQDSAFRHGPYAYLHFRENGRLIRQYLRPDEVEDVRMGIELRHRYQADLRSLADLLADTKRRMAKMTRGEDWEN